MADARMAAGAGARAARHALDVIDVACAGARGLPARSARRGRAGAPGKRQGGEGGCYVLSDKPSAADTTHLRCPSREYAKSGKTAPMERAFRALATGGKSKPIDGRDEMNAKLSRRDTLKLMVNMGVATFAGGAMLASRSVFAQQATAVLGHFGSANPQTFGKATGAFAKAFGPNVKTEFVDGRRRPAGDRRHRRQQHGYLQCRLVADGGGLRARHQDVDGLRREVHHRQRVPGGAQGRRHQHAQGTQGQEDRPAVQHLGAFRDACRAEDRRTRTRPTSP